MRVILTEEALTSLETLLEFMIEAQEIPITIVQRLHQELIEVAESLTDQPLKGQKELLLSDSSIEYRRLVVRHVKVIYPVDQSIIYIDRIFDSCQHPDKFQG